MLMNSFYKLWKKEKKEEKEKQRNKKRKQIRLSKLKPDHKKTLLRKWKDDHRLGELFTIHIFD